MITLYGSFASFGLPQASPFVMKSEVQLKMAGVRYRLERGAPQDGPKGKVPFIVDGDMRLGDSTFIRAYIEAEHGIDLDRGLTAEMRGRAWAIERMLEDHLYWAILNLRWMDEENFAKGPAHFFDALPEGQRDQARAARRQQVGEMLRAHGLGRHSPAEIEALGRRSIAALAALLGNKRHLMGPEPTAVDATAFAMMASLLTPFFTSGLRDDAAGFANLVAYCERMMGEYYPAFARKAA